MKRTLALALALILASTVFGCGQSAQPQSETTSGSSDETVAEAETTEAETTGGREVKDNLPDMDLNGLVFNVLIREEVSREFDTEQTGDLINDAVYQRNQSIGERFNLSINYVNQPGLWGSKDSFQKLITNSVYANESTYDVVTGQSNIILPLASQKVYCDIAESKYLDYSQPYWGKGYIENVKINGHLYTLCGDYALSTLYCSNVLFFNKSVMDDYGLEYPYQLVKDGKWTLDSFLSLCSDISADLDGDGTIGIEDFHGFAAYGNSIVPFTWSCGLSYTKVGDDGKRVFDFPSTKDVEVFDKIYAFYNSESMIDTNKVYPSDTESYMSTDFMGGKYMMMGMTLEGVELLRDMDVDFGIVPYPKYDETQENYVTSQLSCFTVAAITISASDPELSGLLLEALGCEGYNNIVPAYYEIALKRKYTRDEDSVEMLDIISSTSYFDFTDAFYSDLGTVSDFLITYVQGKAGLASSFESNKKRYEQLLSDLYAAYED